MVHGILDDNFIFKDKNNGRISADSVSFMAYICYLFEFSNLPSQLAQFIDDNILTYLLSNDRINKPHAVGQSKDYFMSA